MQSETVIRCDSSVIQGARLLDEVSFSIKIGGQNIGDPGSYILGSLIGDAVQYLRRFNKGHVRAHSDLFDRHPDALVKFIRDRTGYCQEETCVEGLEAEYLPHVCNFLGHEMFDSWFVVLVSDGICDRLVCQRGNDIVVDKRTPLDAYPTAILDWIESIRRLGVIADHPPPPSK